MTNTARAIDHIGWDLHCAAAAWKAAFSAGMAAAGHTWFAQARSGLIQHIGPKGVRQSDLVARSGLSKQAVQQFVDDLIADGIVDRKPDMGDGRAKWVVFTERGAEAMRTADRIKREIEARYQEQLGTERFAALRDGLRLLLEERGRDDVSSAAKPLPIPPKST